MRTFAVYLIGWVLSLAGFTYVNLAISFKHWNLSGVDYVYGCSFALVLVVTLLFTYNLIYRHEPNETIKLKSLRIKLRRLKLNTTIFFLFVSINNLVDEMLFDPYVVNWYEYVTALILLILAIHVVNRIEKNRI